MKKILLGMVVVSGLMACQKNSVKTNTDETMVPTTTTAQEERQNAKRYIAEDGKDVLVTRGYYQNKPYIKVRANGKDIQVINRNSMDTLRYEENGIIMLVEGDSLKIEQQNQIIKLRRAK